MDWMESQVDARMRLDAELTERAYQELAASVSPGMQTSHLSLDEVGQTDGAVRVCLKYLGVEPGEVPSKITDKDERIDWLCRPTGTMRRAVRLDEGWYKQSFGAMLGQLDTGESVALLPNLMRGYCYLDPQTGKRVKVTSTTAARIAPEATLFYKPLPARKLGVVDLSRFIFGTFDPSDYLSVFAATLVSTLMGLVPAVVNQVAYGTVVPSGEVSLVPPLAALLVGMAISTTLIGSCRNLVMARVSTKLNVVTEAATFGRVLSLPPSFFKQYSSGDLGSRVSSMTMVTQLLVSIMLGSELTAVLSLLYVVQIWSFAPMLAVPAFVIVVTQAVMTTLVTMITVRYERTTMESSAKLSGVVTALLNGVQKIKLAGAEDRAFARWAQGYAEYARAAYNRPTVVRALPAIVGSIGLLGNIALYYFAGVSNVSMADYMAFTVAYGQLSGAIMALADTAGQVAQIDPMFKLVEPILKETPEIAEDKPSVESLSGAIEVSGVSFRYEENGPYILNDLSFTVHPGEYVALVGKSGCGKSTLLRLLLGFEKPERGTIFYGPHDVQKVDLRSLRHHIGMVMQDGSLFLGDIANNITISTPSATIDDAWAAAEIAGIADDIRRMPMGMQTLVLEGGGGISGGQRQRLLIARAVCGSRRILMFDEATSALDNVTQKHVSDSLAKLNCTRVVVAHRLSTVRHCDRIMVVDGGRIAEEGTYEELIARNGLFAELVERQRLDGEA